MSSTIFSGGSRYSSDFQSVIDRSVAIASLPLNQMQTVKSQLSSESTALSGLDSKFSTLRSAVDGLNTAINGTSLGSTVSDTDVLKATIGDGAVAGTYSMQVVDLGSSTSVMSSAALTAVTDPSAQNISSASSYTLTVNGTPYTIKPSAGTLNDLVAAINANTDAGIHATAVNVGTGYRLSLESEKLGGYTIQLNDGTQNLLDTAATPDTTLVTGAKVQYKVGSLPTVVESDSRTVTLSPGVTVDMLTESTSAVTITVSRPQSGISNALTTFLNAYNSAVDALDGQRGKGAGALAGNSVITTLTQSLRNLTGYTGDSGTITSLTDLGLNFDKSGKLSLDGAKLSAATADDMSGVLSFLGSVDDGGFLKAASDVMSGIEDATNGSLKVAINNVTAEMKTQDDRISTEQDRIDTLEMNLQAQMAAADSLIAGLEQQVTYFTNMFQAMSDANKSYQ